MNPAIPTEKHDEVQQGHVRYVGLSNWAAWQVMKAIGITRARNLCSIIPLQAHYTLVGRDLERDIIPMLESENAVTSIIVGAKRPEQLKANIQAARIRLSGEELNTLDEVSRIPEEYPGWMMKMMAGYRDSTES